MQAEEDGVSLLEFFRAQVLNHDAASGAISSTSHGSDSTSFFSPTSNGLTIQENAELRTKLYRICEAAIATLGVSPSNAANNAAVETQMLQDDWFYGATAYSTDFRDLRCA